jgi:hypothetical protein
MGTAWHKVSLATSTVALFAIVACTQLFTQPSQAETRVALVIGNGAYQNVPRLRNAPNDAADVAAALRGSGFDTILAIDVDRAGMEDATIRFAKAARTADVAMFYYSGHALQFGGVYPDSVNIRKFPCAEGLHRF